MTNLLKKNERGFTLIEVVLVLAIAGLLLVVVFLAVSGAQKSRRDSQRKEDLSRVAASLETYASNSNGDYPDDNAKWTSFYNNYVNNTGSNLKDPISGTVYGNGGFTSGTTAATPTVASGTTASTITYALSGRTYQVCIGVEQGVSNCRSNK